MARGETYVKCPQCGSQSRIPIMALQRDNYHEAATVFRYPQLLYPEIMGTSRSHAINPGEPLSGESAIRKNGR